MSFYKLGHLKRQLCTVESGSGLCIVYILHSNVLEYNDVSSAKTSPSATMLNSRVTHVGVD